MLTLENSVLNHSKGTIEGADVTLSLPRATLDKVILQEADLKAELASGGISIEGAADKLGELFSLMDGVDFWFNIVTP